ncbi:MAG: hypothetical protein MAG715_00553 [Methanonatronarchaeales archaeon]|nr:hypothetical protein [Methanonatronarchaeales archaeon]
MRGKFLLLLLFVAVLASGCTGDSPPGNGDGWVRDGSGARSESGTEGDGDATEVPGDDEIGKDEATSVTVTGPDDGEEEEEPEGIVLTLPFAPEDDPHGLLPMGETESHDGEPHVGIDFFWDHEVDIVAPAPGEVIYVEQRTEGHAGTWDVFVRTGEYTVGYTEMGKVNPGLEVGDRVERGELLGTSWEATPEDDHWMIHWEFGYAREGWRDYTTGGRVPHPERLCPMSFFTDGSRSRIQAVWDNVTWVRDGEDLKERFPYICSGVFHEKDE